MMQRYKNQEPCSSKDILKRTDEKHNIFQVQSDEFSVLSRDFIFDEESYIKHGYSELLVTCNTSSELKTEQQIIHIDKHFSSRFKQEEVRLFNDQILITPWLTKHGFISNKHANFEAEKNSKKSKKSLKSKLYSKLKPQASTNLEESDIECESSEKVHKNDNAKQKTIKNELLNDILFPKSCEISTKSEKKFPNSKKNSYRVKDNEIASSNGSSDVYEEYTETNALTESRTQFVDENINEYYDGFDQKSYEESDHLGNYFNKPVGFVEPVLNLNFDRIDNISGPFNSKYSRNSQRDNRHTYFDPTILTNTRYCSDKKRIPPNQTPFNVPEQPLHKKPHKYDCAQGEWLPNKMGTKMNYHKKKDGLNENVYKNWLWNHGFKGKEEVFNNFQNINRDLCHKLKHDKKPPLFQKPLFKQEQSGFKNDPYLARPNFNDGRNETNSYRNEQQYYNNYNNPCNNGYQVPNYQQEYTENQGNNNCLPPVPDYCTNNNMNYNTNPKVTTWADQANAGSTTYFAQNACSITPVVCKMPTHHRKHRKSSKRYRNTQNCVENCMPDKDYEVKACHVKDFEKYNKNKTKAVQMISHLLLHRNSSSLGRLMTVINKKDKTKTKDKSKKKGKGRTVYIMVRKKNE